LVAVDRIGHVLLDLMLRHLVRADAEPDEKAGEEHEDGEEDESDRIAAATGLREAVLGHGAPFAPARRALYSPRLVANGVERVKKSIALVGLPGAGKTTTGRRLAARLGLPFQDSDAAIEVETGLTVQDIFRQAGEAQFREVERRAIARLAEGHICVLATGGGAF